MDTYASEREQLDAIIGSYSQMGNLNYADQVKVRKLINDMAAKLKSQVRELPPPDYMACKSFLNSLIYATTKVQLS